MKFFLFKITVWRKIYNNIFRYKKIGREIGIFFIEESDLSIVKIYNQNEMHSYSYKEEITNEKIVELLNKYEKNELIREKNSEQIPFEEEDQNISLKLLLKIIMNYPWKNFLLFIILLEKTFNKEIYNRSLKIILFYLVKIIMKKMKRKMKNK